MSGIGSAVQSEPQTTIRPAEVPNELSLMNNNFEHLETTIEQLASKLESISYKEPNVSISEKVAEPPGRDPRCEVSARLNAYNKRLIEIAANIDRIRNHIEL